MLPIPRISAPGTIAQRGRLVSDNAASLIR